MSKADIEFEMVMARDMFLVLKRLEALLGPATNDTRAIHKVSYARMIVRDAIKSIMLRK